MPRIVNLAPPSFRLDDAALAEAFSDRTKLVLLNNPLNPSATLFGRDDLATLARFCCVHDVIALCDEVWEHVVFDGARHGPLMGLPGMRERTVKIGSAGKIFSLTGWKVGFVTAEARLMQVLAKAHQFLTFTTPPNLQAAVAYGLAKDEAWFEAMRAGYARSRDRLAAGLTERGFCVLPAAATWFLNIDIAALGHSDDVAFCEAMVAQSGVAAIPVSAFYPDGRCGTSSACASPRPTPPWTRPSIAWPGWRGRLSRSPRPVLAGNRGRGHIVIMSMSFSPLPPRDFPHQTGPRPGDTTFAALDLGREASLARLETLAHLMDTAFVIPGINRRVGFDALIGLVPIIGDVAGMVISSFIVYEARRLAPRAG